MGDRKNASKNTIDKTGDQKGGSTNTKQKNGDQKAGSTNGEKNRISSYYGTNVLFLPFSRIPLILLNPPPLSSGHSALDMIQGIVRFANGYRTDTTLCARWM